MKGLFDQREHGAHARLALSIAALMLCAALLLSQQWQLPLPEIKPFLPIYATCIILLEGLTGYLLLSQFITSRQWHLGILASSYLLLIPLVAIQLMVFPGVFSDSGLLNAGKQSAVWIWVFWHGGFPAVVSLALLVERCVKQHTVPVADIRLWTWNFALLPLLLGTALGLVATWFSQNLPELITSNSYKQLLYSPFAIMVWLVNIAALLLMVQRSRQGGVMYIWLSLALFASLLDVTLTLAAGARYSLGWYAARVSSSISATVLLGVLLWEINKLYINTKRANELLYQQSMQDGLTGIFNRRFFDSRLPQELKLAAQRHTSLALLLLDVDHFKRFNDLYGHAVGDNCLRMVATTMQGSLKRPADFVARYGGEEFGIVLPDTDIEGARLVAERLCRKISDIRLQHGEGFIGVTASVGVALWQVNSGDRAAELIGRADKALYRAKDTGRNRVVIF